MVTNGSDSFSGGLYDMKNSRSLTILSGLIFLSIDIALPLGDPQQKPLQQLLSDEAIPLVDNREGPLRDGPLFKFEEDLVVGGDEDGPDWQLFQWPFIHLVGPTGAMYIVDRNDVYIVNSQGQLIRKLGGDGEGPGEFRMLYRLHWVSDGEEFWAQDISLSRMSRFTADGELIDTFHTRPSSSGLNIYSSIGNGAFVVMRFNNSESARGIEHITFELAKNQFTETAPIIEYRYQDSHPTEVGTIRIPFQSSPRIQAFPDGRLILAAPTDQLLLILNSEAEPLFRISRLWDQSEVSSADIRAWKQRLLGLPTPYGRAYAEKDFRSVPVPKYRSPFTNLVTDYSGRIWLMLPQPPKQNVDDERSDIRVDLFNQEGRWIGTQTLPFKWSMPAVIRDGFMYYSPMNPDYDEVPRVIRIRMTQLYP